ncbi:alkaline phosphatase D family protein [Gloeobacter violaceus]|uniref:Phosphodiesterase/alkaline phosphatase D n=1 Tax=Gloeobacter violaceus (strain ATCC 29082 / PCC 7421) TaxID=251221 RepID=Q7NNC1_GLOVI|nr:alkaline phosphatase D family protein [Gloeobacter violaceus]BAC88431.1 phosphodiesterase/alkaline phosphatase D [Gloeobacter violaceus PCC 7421]
MRNSRPPLESFARKSLNRRQFLAVSGTLAGAFALALASGEDARSAPSLGATPFTLGVASGDPLPTSIVLWTRLAPDPLVADGGMPARRVSVEWFVATDAGMRRIVRRGTALASPELVHSVHVEVFGLEPSREYYYQFRYRSEYSPIGRTKTAPAAGSPLNSLAFAIATCQKWDDGFYSPYRRMVEEDLDLVVHLGDYTYEYGIASGGVRGATLPDTFAPETVTLDRYRLQHALYKTDPDLQAAHARFPWVVTWDDHEVENDYTDAISENFEPVETFLARRAAAYKAYYEHLPLRRLSIPDGPNLRLYRRLAFGDLAEFNVLDTRQYRSDQPCGDGESDRCEAALDPTKTMAGFDQERWLRQGLEGSGALWNVLAQQVLMAELNHDLEGGTRYWNDGWDGYPVARQRLLRHIATQRIANPVVITGDWHSTFVSDLKLDFKNPDSLVVAAEFVTPSITTNGDAIVYGPYYGPMIPQNPHIKFFDGDRRGYIRCHLDRERWLADIRYVESVSTPDSPIETFASFVIENGQPGVQPA